MKTWAKLLFALLLLCRSGHAQGFVNLNFESVTINNNGAPPFEIVASNAIPSWIAYLDGVPQTYILYNNVSTGAAAVSLQGTNSPHPYPAIQGEYFIFLQSNTAGQPNNSAAIGQTGQIPLLTQSLMFFGDYSGTISFDGYNLSFSQIGNAANYNIYEADVSAFAGQTGQLLFTAEAQGGGFIDNIQFSPSPVPEPGAMSLSALGALFLAWHRRKK